MSFNSHPGAMLFRGISSLTLAYGGSMEINQSEYVH